MFLCSFNRFYVEYYVNSIHELDQAVFVILYFDVKSINVLIFIMVVLELVLDEFYSVLNNSK
jgi:hypothetical protein